MADKYFLTLLELWSRWPEIIGLPCNLYISSSPNHSWFMVRQELVPPGFSLLHSYNSKGEKECGGGGVGGGGREGEKALIPWRLPGGLPSSQTCEKLCNDFNRSSLLPTSSCWVSGDGRLSGPSCFKGG